MRILVVCSGNICRSPMVAAMLRQRVRERGMDHVAVDSAGTLGLDGQPAAPEAVAALAEIGIDLAHHRSRGLQSDDMHRANLVIGMTHAHLTELARRFPRPPVPRQLLRAFEHGPQPDPAGRELDDPIGEGLEVYRAQRTIIARCVDHLLERVGSRP